MRDSVQDQGKRRLRMVVGPWFSGTMLAAVLWASAQVASGQATPDQDVAPQVRSTQSAVMQKHKPEPLTVDSDPVPSPDATPAPGPHPYSGQPQAVVKQNGNYTLVTNTYLVRLNASVVDSSGHQVDSLPESAFKVYEDGVQQKIVEFSHEDQPISLGILIDSSGSMYDKRPAVDAAALNLVKLSNPKDQAFLVDFNTEPYIDQDFTNSIAKLQQGLSYIKAGGGTALYDAVIASADYLAKDSQEPKQVLLIVTDGADNASNATLDQTIRRVQQLDGPSIYCIGLLFGGDLSRKEAKESKRVLTELADQTGGQAYFPKKLQSVDAVARKVAKDIRSQYLIEYRPSKPMSLGGYRTIHVVVDATGYHGLRVRTRAGYFPKVAGQAAPGAPTAPAKQ
ncbi:MAG: VWA domain-containing protein [Acidobacteriaceae bacterium]